MTKADSGKTTKASLRGSAGRAIRVVLMASAVLVSGLAAFAQDDPFDGAASLDRRELIHAVLERNPGIEAMRQAWLAAGEREAQATAFEDLRVRTAVAPESIWGEDRLGYMVQVEQMIPWSGKRGSKGAMERAMAEATRGRYESARLEIALTASMLYDEIYSARRMLVLNEHHIRLMRKAKESAEARYVASAASLQDPIEAEVAIARMEKEEARLEAMIAILEARLNALLHRESSAPLPPTPTTLDPLPPEIEAPDELQRVALESRPELASVDARIEAEQAGVELADRDRFPDLVVSAAYNTMMMGPEHRFQVGVGLNIPNQREKRRAQLREAEVKVEMEKQRRAETEDVVRLEVETARTDFEKARRIFEIYESRLVPAGRDRLDAAEAGFSSGTNDFSTVVAATNDLRQLEIERETTLAELYTYRAQLDRALGRLPFEQEEVK